MGILNENVGGASIARLGVAGITKYAGERALSPVVGNATPVSGAVKLGAGLAVDQMGSSGVSQGIALGLGVDGIEDLLTWGLGQANFGGAQSMTQSRGVM